MGMDQRPDERDELLRHDLAGGFAALQIPATLPPGPRSIQKRRRLTPAQWAVTIVAIVGVGIVVLLSQRSTSVQDGDVFGEITITSGVPVPLDGSVLPGARCEDPNSQGLKGGLVDNDGNTVEATKVELLNEKNEVVNFGRLGYGQVARASAVSASPVPCTFQFTMLRMPIDDTQSYRFRFLDTVADVRGAELRKPLELTVGVDTRFVSTGS